ncbi:Hypothetical protein R9X50_00160900 [Acrodontium crateriforme]|uniref:F-box domain-containing protein n=1 Tax=Acrodontium crateriforme TaxID=150365 RepID=A0AAQ3RA74_9PEZI|nr:Hypothetical protein R9X50_00160900 [Acrodontium crateriforme]
MEAAPPTYEKATVVDHLDLIARYIPSSDLCSAALVCSKWHATFAPHIWGNPASHFGIENDRVYVALTRFKRVLQTARLLVRSMTHTLHLPPAHAEIYNGPRSDWLRESLERLPNLQSLIVRGLPFFDHSALLALKEIKPQQTTRMPPGMIELPGSTPFNFQAPSSNLSGFELRLLDASRCSNVTSRGLAQALCRFEKLIYLDLSFTYPARDPSVMATLRRLSGIQVLKLRGISLTDEGLEVLAQAIGLRVRSLDIRDNHLSDRSVRILLDNCFTFNANDSVRDNNACENDGTRSPSLLPYLGSEMLEIYQGEDFEGYLRSQFTGSFVSRLAIEDAPEGGITHLYAAGNNFTVEGVSGLLRSGRLHVFDIDAIKSGTVQHYSFPENNEGLGIPGVEKLTPVLSDYAAISLTFLRIEHSVVTKDAPVSHPDEIIPGRLELDDTSLPVMPAHAIELGTTSAQSERFELPAVQTPRAELPGDPMQFIVSAAPNETDRNFEDDYFSGPRRGSAFAPELVDLLATETDRLNLLSPVSDVDEGAMTYGAFSPTGGLVSPVDNTLSSSPFQIPTFRPRSYSSLGTERKARLTAHRSKYGNLHPAMLPHITSLVLTNVPAFSSNKEVSDRLIQFIRQCSEESWLAKKQANLDYSAPPGRKGHASAIRHSTNKIFALKRVVIELESEQFPRKNSVSTPWRSANSRSLTEDRDSESLWTAAETDFSFFGEGEECDMPSLEPGRFADSFGSNEKEVSFGNGSGANQQTQKASQPPTRYDNVALLSTFRKERKLAHERMIAAGCAMPETEGFWDGLVQVVRDRVGVRFDEQVDYYGNRFTGGYLYR